MWVETLGLWHLVYLIGIDMKPWAIYPSHQILIRIKDRWTREDLRQERGEYIGLVTGGKQRNDLVSGLKGDDSWIERAGEEDY